MENWKASIYNRYSSNFGRVNGADTYRTYVPMGKKIIRKGFPSNKQIRILDLGCGKGGYVKVFLDSGYHQITGIEISEEEIAIAHEAGLHQVKQGELLSEIKRTAGNSYDVILLLDIVEHFSREDLFTILNESYRLLSDDGCLIMHVPNAEGIFGNRIRYADITHELAFTFGSLSQVCRHAGFKHFAWYEDKPIIHNITSFIRRLIWDIGTIPFRLLFAAETGTFRAVLSQNILFKAIK